MQMLDRAGSFSGPAVREDAPQVSEMARPFPARFHTTKTRCGSRVGQNAVMHNTAFFNDVVGCDPRLRAAHEAAPVHHIARWRGGVAARGARAASEVADHWLSGGEHPFELESVDRGLPAAAA